MRRLWPLVAFVLACVPPKPGPAEVWRAFAEAAAKRDANGAWGLLSAESQGMLTRAARAVAAVEGQPEPPDGRRLIFSDVSTQPALKQTEAVFDGPDAARVLVLDEADGRGTVRFVREEGRWKLDVTEELRRASSR